LSDCSVEKKEVHPAVVGPLAHAFAACCKSDVEQTF
jgi:hypothetical protein